MIRHALLVAMALGLLLTAADARSHPEGRRGVPAMVAGCCPPW